MKKLCSLALLLVATHLFSQDVRDYRSRTIYFLLTDWFYPHQPYDPYIDPLYPDATNSVDCFAQGCMQEEEFRKYWGGDLRGLQEKLSYIHSLGASAIWVSPLAENVRMYEGGTGYGTLGTELLPGEPPLRRLN